MSSVASKWRQFKTNLISFYVFGKYKDKRPCEMYGIDEETWQLFVRTRLDSSWQVYFLLMVHFDKVIVPSIIYEYCLFNRKRERKLKLSKKKNVTPHILSRGGYDLLEKRMMEEKLKKQMDIAAAEEVPSPPSPPSRHEK